jgi:hypothetical protein
MYEYDDLRSEVRLAGDWSRPADLTHIRRDRFLEYSSEHQPLHASSHAGHEPVTSMGDAERLAGPEELPTTFTPEPHARHHAPLHTPLHAPEHSSRWLEGKP